jgi:hypothetical protein
MRIFRVLIVTAFLAGCGKPAPSSKATGGDPAPPTPQEEASAFLCGEWLHEDLPSTAANTRRTVRVSFSPDGRYKSVFDSASSGATGVAHTEEGGTWKLVGSQLTIDPDDRPPRTEPVVLKVGSAKGITLDGILFTRVEKPAK